jgi:hypothetical protein
LERQPRKFAISEIAMECLHWHSMNTPLPWTSRIYIAKARSGVHDRTYAVDRAPKFDFCPADAIVLAALNPDLSM